MNKSKLFIGLFALIAIISFVAFGMSKRNAALNDNAHADTYVITDEQITTYLKKSNFADVNFGGEVFIAFHRFSEEISNTRTTVYLWLVAQEYYLKDGDLKQGTGISLPLALFFDNGNLIAINAPRDGAAYSEDLAAIFPESVRNEASFSNTEEHNTVVALLNDQARSQAQTFYGRAVASTKPTSTGKKCVTCLTEANNGASITMTVTSRVSIELSQTGYDQANLTLSSANLVGETFGADAQEGNWIRVFEGVAPGTLTISVPASTPDYKDFTATVTIEE